MCVCVLMCLFTFYVCSEPRRGGGCALASLKRHDEPRRQRRGRRGGEGGAESKSTAAERREGGVESIAVAEREKGRWMGAARGGTRENTAQANLLWAAHTHTQTRVDEENRANGSNEKAKNQKIPASVTHTHTHADTRNSTARRAQQRRAGGFSVRSVYSRRVCTR